MATTKHDAQSLWDGFAQKDLMAQANTARQFELAPRNPLGTLLLAVAKKHIFSYAVADVPKLTWVSDALHGTGEHVLDVGVRTGASALFFKQAGKRVWGIDIAQSYVDHCRSRGLIEGGSVCDLTVDDIPAPSDYCAGMPGQYDVVYFSEVIEHLLDGGAVLKKLAGVIKPGGHLILTTPNLAYLGNRLRLLFGRDLDTLTMDRGDVGNQHIRVFTARLLKRLCANAGLEVDMVGSDGVPVNLSRHIAVVSRDSNPRTGPDYPAQMAFPFTRTLAPTFGRTIYIRARRMAG
jgi:2-polyprenyl-3-methyl-5-hydroxy-6-metoxy-1,4-benzoquinol methylase